jgi:hypothetical protein
MQWDCPGGIRHAGGAKLNLALARNVRTWPAMSRKKAQGRRPRVEIADFRKRNCNASFDAGHHERL